MPPLDHTSPVSGPDYWRSLDQLADTPAFQEFLHREFPAGAAEFGDGLSRRKFLTLMGASVALAGLAGCRRPIEKIVPYVVPPENLIPGIPQYYASAIPLGTSAYGVLVESHEGRPTKIDGHDKHPSTLGKSNAILQAAILGMYDPDRSATILERGTERTWEEFVVWWQDRYTRYGENRGAGLAVLSEAFAAPTLHRLRTEFLAKFPEARWIAYEPVSDDNRDRGLRAVTGKNVRPVYHFERAKRILSLDCDFLLSEPENITATLGFAAARRVESTSDEMNRLYVVEGRYSLTGTKADHRLRVPTRHIPAFAAQLANTLKRKGLSLAVDTVPATGSVFDQHWIDTVADDLLAHRGASLILVGQSQPAAAHALVHMLNDALGNTGSTIEYHEYADTLPSSRDELAKLVARMKAGQVKTLVILGGNPVYNAPADLDFAGALSRVGESIHVSLHVDETSAQTAWHIPRTHALESWGDTRSANGARCVIQPLIAPMFNGHSDVEFASVLVLGHDQPGYDVVRETWKNILPAFNFEKSWEQVLNDGILSGDASKPADAAFDGAGIAHLSSELQLSVLPPGNSVDVVLTPSPAVYDGRFANNGWLQELPDAVSKVTWDNPALISPRTARELGLANGDVIELSLGGRKLEIPVWIQPGQADREATIALGYGRRRAGRVGSGVGFNAYALMGGASALVLLGAQVRTTGRTHKFASTQDHGSMEGRPIVREGTLDQFRANPEFASEMVEVLPLKSLWKEHSYENGNQWGMSIDLSTCTGCNACTIACQSENNIPIVGKEQVARGREMHWIRIDRYYSGSEDDPGVVHQPVTCQQCENAPCEQVCPVAATTHTPDGLNAMAYNRCIGTRYCSNNCPYKVRRFNFFNYTKDLPDVVQMAMNPDVTVRFRGVMEKCTFCVQRISRARITAKDEERELRDGDIVTACQQACPADAIVFGDINDPDSNVSKKKKLQQKYELLAEFNLRPRNSFLAKLTNPNPKLVTKPSGSMDAGHHG